MERKQAQGVVGRYQAIWPQPQLPPSTVATWADLLEPHDYDVALSVLHDLAGRPDRFPPGVGGILAGITARHTGRLPDDREAWGEVVANLREPAPVVNADGTVQRELPAYSHGLIRYALNSRPYLAGRIAAALEAGDYLGDLEAEYRAAYRLERQQVEARGQLPAGVAPEPEPRRLSDAVVARPALEAGDDADDVEGVPPPPEAVEAMRRLGLKTMDEQPADGA